MAKTATRRSATRRKAATRSTTRRKPAHSRKPTPRKATRYWSGRVTRDRSALSMLVFYINRAGKKLPASRRRTLERAKGELRRQFGRD